MAGRKRERSQAPRSASPVLTATGFVNGKWLFSTPPQNRHPSTDHQKICHRWLRRQPLRLCQIRCIFVHVGLLGTWAYLCPFLGTHLQVRQVDEFSHMMAQTTRTRARMCLFGNFTNCSPFRGLKTPILEREYAFWSQTCEIEKRAYYQNHCIDSNQNYFYLCPFFWELTYRSDRSTDFHAW